MEITEHERVLLVNSLIQTISELYEHDGDKDRPALAALLTRMTAAPARDPCDACGKSHEPVRQASARDDRLRADRSLLAPCARRTSALVPAGAPPPGRAPGVPPAYPAAPCRARPPTAMRRMPPGQSALVRLVMSTALRPRPARVSRKPGAPGSPPHPGVASPRQDMDRTV